MWNQVSALYGCAVALGIAGVSLGVGLQQQSKPAKFPFHAIVIAVPIAKELGQMVAGNLVELALLADQMHCEGQFGYGQRRIWQQGFFVQPFLRR